MNKGKLVTPKGKQLKRGLQIHVLQDGTIGMAMTEKMSDLEVSRMLSGALGMMITKMTDESKKTTVDKAREHKLVVPQFTLRGKNA